MISSISLDLKRLTLLGAVPEEPFRMKVKHHQLACKETDTSNHANDGAFAPGEAGTENNEPLVVISISLNPGTCSGLRLRLALGTLAPFEMLELMLLIGFNLTSRAAELNCVFKSQGCGKKSLWALVYQSNAWVNISNEANCRMHCPVIYITHWPVLPAIPVFLLSSPGPLGSGVSL